MSAVRFKAYIRGPAPPGPRRFKRGSSRLLWYAKNLLGISACLSEHAQLLESGSRSLTLTAQKHLATGRKGYSIQGVIALGQVDRCVLPCPVKWKSRAKTNRHRLHCGGGRQTGLNGSKSKREDGAKDRDVTAQTHEGCSVLPLPWTIECTSNRGPAWRFLPNVILKEGKRLPQFQISNQKTKLPITIP